MTIPQINSQSTFKNWRDTTNLLISGLVDNEDLATRAHAIAKNFEYDSTASTGLVFAVKAGVAQNFGEVYNLAADSVTLTPSGDFVVYLDKPLIGAPTLEFANWGAQPTQGVIVLYRVATDESNVTTIEDLRTFADFSGSDSGSQLTEQLQTIADGETDVDLTAGTPQVTAINGIAVYVDGVRQTVGTDYTIINPTLIRFSTPLQSFDGTGTRVLCVANDITGSPLAIVATKQSFDALIGEDTFEVTDFDLNGPVAVYVGGVRQDDDAYSINLVTNEVVLVEPLVADTRVMIVKSDIESTVVFRSLPIGGAEGQHLVKKTSDNFDSGWVDSEALSSIVNGGMSVANGTTIRPSMTKVQSPIDELFVYTNYATPTSPIACDVRQIKVNTDIAKSGFATEFKIDAGNVPINNETTFEYRISSAFAAKFENQPAVIQCKIKHDSTEALQAKVYLYRLDPTGVANNFETGTLQLISSSTFSAISNTGTQTLVARIPTVTQVDDGLVVRIELSVETALATAVKTITLSDVTFTVGNVAWPFNPSVVERDAALLSSIQSVGFVDWFPVSVSDVRGYIRCDNQQLDVAAYSNLFRKIGYSFVLAGEDVSTPTKFRVPSIADNGILRAYIKY